MMCEYCEGSKEIVFNNFLRRNYSRISRSDGEIKLYEGFMGVSSEVGSEKIKYCPMCGKRLNMSDMERAAVDELYS